MPRTGNKIGEIGVDFVMDSEHTCPIIKSAYEPFTGILRTVPAYRTHAETNSNGVATSHCGWPTEVSRLSEVGNNAQLV
jgi:hypothetical protein